MEIETQENQFNEHFGEPESPMSSNAFTVPFNRDFILTEEQINKSSDVVECPSITVSLPIKKIIKTTTTSDKGK